MPVSYSAGSEMESILIGSDHAGFPMKTFLKGFLEKHTRVIDVGCTSAESCDYPIYAQDLCRRIINGEASRGILICGTGLGMSIAANRQCGIRAALCTTEFHARMSRLHNDSNVLVLGGRVTGEELALSILKVWLETGFEGGRHQRRLNLTDAN
jgi:ribose 5-phosphate isomerase B